MRIEDVAKRAGVSIKTVSRVVNMEPNVRSTTRERVLTAIAELNYQPNSSARSLAGNRSYLIGLLYDNPSANYVIDVQGGVLKRCRKEGYDLLIHPCDYRDPKLDSDILRLLRQTRIDGVILTPPLSDLPSVAEILDKQEIPYVRLSPADYQHGSPSVHTDDQRAAMAMTQHLLGLGHRRIAFIAGHPDHRAVAQRQDGFREAMKAAGLRVTRHTVAQGYNSFESGVTCARQLLARNPRATAIFASNDDMAAGVIRVAHEQGLSIPGDLSVAGFDDSPVASQIWPALTTVRQPVQAMADSAAGLLVDRLRLRSVPVTEVSMATELVLRDSTGPAPNSASQEKSAAGRDCRFGFADRETV